MKCVILTGITGSERRRYLQELVDSRKQSLKLLVIDPWLKTKELHKDIDESTILNIDDEIRLDYFSDAYRAISHELEDLRTGQQYEVAVVPMHSAFYWRSIFKDAIREQFLRWLDPDLFITIVHNIKRVKSNLDKDTLSRFHDITYSDILHWRSREINETSIWAKKYRKQHFVIARNEPVETLEAIIFNNKVRIYFSYPMSYVSNQEMAKAKNLINTLRSIGYIVFDPNSIDDAKFVVELRQQQKSKQGIISEQELSRISRMVEDHTVDLDYRLIKQSNIVIIRYPSVEYQKYIVERDEIVPAIYVPLSAGVVCEMVKGDVLAKKVFAVWLPAVEPSPFFRHHCFEIFRTEQELIKYLNEREPPK